MIGGNLTCSNVLCTSISFPEAAIILVSDGDRDLWPGPTPEVRDSRTSRHSAHAQSQVWQIWLVVVSNYCVYKAIQNQNVVGPGQGSRFPAHDKRDPWRRGCVHLCHKISPIPIYIHDSNTGMGVQLELWAWVFNAVRVSLQSSNKISYKRHVKVNTTQAIKLVQPPDTKTQKSSGKIPNATKYRRTNLWGLKVT